MEPTHSGARTSSQSFAKVVPQSPSAYENRFARYLGADVMAFAFWKGRVALYAILRALDIGPGDEVVLPGYTCVVVPNAARMAGAMPVYADIAEESYNLDPDSVEKAITPKSKALIIQHTYGLPAPMPKLEALASKYNLHIIEDCAHALGSTHNGHNLGTLGAVAFFSSQWSKPYTTGLGGIAVTQDPNLAARLRQVQSEFREPSRTARLRIFVQLQIYKRFFSPRVYWLAQGILRSMGRLGLFVASSSKSELAGGTPQDHDWRMGQFQQEVGLRKLGQLPANLKHSRALAAIYDEGLLKGNWPKVSRLDTTVLLRYPIRVGNKADLLSTARRQRIEMGSWFETPLHDIPLSEHYLFDYAPGQCPNAEAAAAEVVNLPLHSRVTPAEADRILGFFLNHARD